MKQTFFILSFSLLPMFAVAQMDSTFTDVCKNDTIRLYDWQYDSTLHYRQMGLGRRIRTTVNRSDTILRVGKAEYFPEEFSGWLRDYLTNWWDCTNYYVYYNSGELHFTFVDEGEGPFGEYREYHKNGVVKCQGNYCPEKPDFKYGEWIWYDEQGKIIRTKKYKGGMYCTESDPKMSRRIYPFWHYW